MTTQHTPGPWHIEVDGNGWLSICQGGLIAELPDDPEHIVGPNARLIAAAPDLLAALEAVADYWAGGDVPEALDTQMHAAIAKARGQ